MKPAFFFGYEDAGRAGGRLTTPEKALVDSLYPTPARSRLFRALPELEWPKAFKHIFDKTGKSLLWRGIAQDELSDKTDKNAKKLARATFSGAASTGGPPPPRQLRIVHSS